MTKGRAVGSGVVAGRPMRVWRAGAAAAAIWLAIGASDSGQTDTGAAYDGASATEALCRQYAAAQTGMPADLMFSRCMAERHCRLFPGTLGYRCELPGPMSWHGGGY